jgi:uncharacterized protein
VSNKLPSREQAIELLRKNHCPPEIIRHCEAVATVALEIANKLSAKGIPVNLQLVEIGALLHDIGRSTSNKVDHGVVGGKIAQEEGLPDAVVRIIKRHVGGGITDEEAECFGWTKDVYVPVTLEEKIVSYADKLIDNSRRVSINLEIERLRKEQMIEASERVRKLHQEITDLIGNEKWTS